MFRYFSFLVRQPFGFYSDGISGGFEKLKCAGMESRKGSVYVHFMLRRGAISLIGECEIPRTYPRDLPRIRSAIQRTHSAVSSDVTALYREHGVTEASERKDFYMNESKNIEMAVNTDVSYLRKLHDANFILSAMIYKTQLCFDVYLDSLQQEGGKQGLKLMQASLSPQNKAFFHLRSISTGGCSFAGSKRKR